MLKTHSLVFKNLIFCIHLYFALSYPTTNMELVASLSPDLQKIIFHYLKPIATCKIEKANTPGHPKSGWTKYILQANGKAKIMFTLPIEKIHINPREMIAFVNAVINDKPSEKPGAVISVKFMLSNRELLSFDFLCDGKILYTTECTSCVLEKDIYREAFLTCLRDIRQKKFGRKD